LAFAIAFIHDDDIALFKLRHQNLFEIGTERIAIHGAVEHHGGDHAGKAQSGGKGRRFPMTMGDRGAAALTARCPAAYPMGRVKEMARWSRPPNRWSNLDCVIIIDALWLLFILNFLSCSKLSGAVKQVT
jgi:hypothetical protein